jgi:hypothetical protein
MSPIDLLLQSDLPAPQILIESHTAHRIKVEVLCKSSFSHRQR